MEKSSRLIHLDGVYNLRDMGGYKVQDGRTVRWGRIYRSGCLNKITATCSETLIKHQITSVVDFQSAHEKSEQPMVWPPHWQPRYYAAAIGGNAAAWIQEMLARIDSDKPLEKEMRAQLMRAYETIPIENCAGLKTFFDAILEATPDTALLFHCKAGKDRTGIAGALLMKALGATDDDIMEDYMLTNVAVDIERYAAVTAESLSKRTGRTIAPQDVIPLVGVEENYLKTSFKVIADQYGSIDAYLEKAMDLTPMRLRNLEARLLST